MAHDRQQHPNAVLTPAGRRRMVACVVDRGHSEGPTQKTNADQRSPTNARRIPAEKRSTRDSMVISDAVALHPALSLASFS